MSTARKQPAKTRPIARPTPRWTRRAGVAAYLLVSMRTIDNWIARGLIVAYRMPGERGLVFDLNEVDELIRSRGPVVPPSPDAA